MSDEYMLLKVRRVKDHLPSRTKATWFCCELEESIVVLNHSHNNRIFSNRTTNSDEGRAMQNDQEKAEATEFQGRRILVTGGTRGIGEAIVNRMIRGKMKGDLCQYEGQMRNGKAIWRKEVED